MRVVLLYDDLSEDPKAFTHNRGTALAIYPLIFSCACPLHHRERYTEHPPKDTSHPWPWQIQLHQ